MTGASHRRRLAHGPERDGEELFRAAFDEAPIGMAILALDGRFLRVNKSLCRLVGYTAEELRGRTADAITHPDDEDVHLALTDQLLRGELVSYELAKRCVKKDGTVVDAVMIRSVVRDVEGKPLHFVVQIEDVGDAKRTREALERSEERLRSLFDQASDAILIADVDGRFTEVNPAACAMLGYTREELLGKVALDVVLPQDAERLARVREYLLVSGQAQVAEWTIRKKDGSLVTVESSTKILPDGRWQSFVRDVEERRRTEAALEESEQALNRAQRVARVASWDWDLDKDVVHRSKQFYELFGVEPRPELEQRGAFAEAIGADERAEVQRVVDEAVRERRAYTIEHRIVRADGEERIVRQQGEPVVENGRAVRMVGTLLDITDLRRAELEREVSLRRFRALFDQCPVGMVLASADGSSIELNPRAEMLLGRAVERAGQFPDIVLGPDERPLALEDLPSSRARRGEHVDDGELLFRQPNGNLVPVLVNAAPLLDAAGAVDGAVIAIQDITSLKQLERLRAEWSSIVAHDLRQPLDAISMSCQLLARGNKDNPKLGAVAQRAIAGTKRLDRMIHDLMDLSRLEAARLELVRQPIDLVSVVQASVEELALDAANPPVTLRARGDVARVQGDPERLMQVMANLLSNAIKYGAPGAPVVVDVTSSASEVSIAVTNQGQGITPEDLPRLFRRFERIERGHHSAIKGVGLGLHITRGIVEAHGGRIEVESTPGATTTFRFTLPAG